MSNDMAIDVLQLYPLDPTLEAELQSRFRIHKWHEITDRDGFVAQVGPRIRGVVTGGHLGTEPLAGIDLPALEIVAINGVGYDKVDLASARARGLRVTNTPDVLTEDVADLAIGLYIALGRKLAAADAFVRDGRWSGGQHFPLARRISGQRYGIVGLGRIGQALARRLEGFGGRISYTGRTARPDSSYQFVPSLLDLAGVSDVLFVCVPGGGATQALIDGPVFAALGPQGLLVNISRGSVIDEAALVEALETGALGGAALDVFASEPAGNPLLAQSERTALTPHIASATRECRREMADLVLANLDAHFAGRPLVTAVI